VGSTENSLLSQLLEKRAFYFQDFQEAIFMEKSRSFMFRLSNIARMAVPKLIVLSEIDQK